MANIVDQRIAELLCSRICHELVAGVAAINNGVELITEIDRSMLDEALDLIGTSARQSSARLQFYRMAYGFAGNDALKSLAEVRDLVERVVSGDNKISTELIDPGSMTELAPGWGKLLLNMFVFAQDCLPRGGRVRYGSENGSRLMTVATGEGAKIPSRYEGFPEPGLSRDDVTALNIQAFYTTFLAGTIGSGLDVGVEEGAVRLSVSVPS
jgi:histidine phosphotransferase ChpT